MIIRRHNCHPINSARRPSEHSSAKLPVHSKLPQGHHWSNLRRWHRAGFLHSRAFFTSTPAQTLGTSLESRPSASASSVFSSASVTSPLLSTPEWNDIIPQQSSSPRKASDPPSTATPTRHPFRYLKMSDTERQIARALHGRQMYHVERLVKRSWSNGEQISFPIYRGIISFNKYTNIEFLDQVVNHLLSLPDSTSTTSKNASKRSTSLDLELFNSILAAYSSNTSCYDKMLSVRTLGRNLKIPKN